VSVWLRRLLMVSVFFMCLLFSYAQEGSDTPFQVFLDRNADEAGQDQLIFLNLVTGEETTTNVDGERFTTLNNSIMYLELGSRRVKIVTPDGQLRDHPFVQLRTGDTRIDWVLDDQGEKIAWTLARPTPTGEFLTDTFIANIDGSNQQLVFQEGPYPDVRALPLAFSRDDSTLYMDINHIDGISNFTPFELYAGIVAVDLATGEFTPLPDENPANCLCGADFQNDLLVRLRLGTIGFDLHVYNLPGEFDNVIPALNQPNYTSAASVLTAPDATQAIYALARVNNFGSENQSIQTIFVLADLQAMTQETLTRPITTFVVPVEWTEDNSAVIFTSPLQDGTWKINLEDGRLQRIANVTYIGTINTR